VRRARPETAAGGPVTCRPATSTTMIAKAFFLAETFYRYSALIFRDHGIWLE
jgi:hypothetical protein